MNYIFTPLYKHLKLSILIATALVLSSTLTQAQAQYKLYAGFIYHFAKYVQWPEQSGDIVVGAIGNSPIVPELLALEGKMVGNRKIVIATFKTIGEVTGCQILFVPQGLSSELTEISTKAKSKNMLVISETGNGAKKGAVINFVQEEGKIRFELSMKAAGDNGLKISADLQKLAIII